MPASCGMSKGGRETLTFCVELACKHLIILDTHTPKATYRTYTMEYMPGIAHAKSWFAQPEKSKGKQKDKGRSCSE